MSQFKKFKLENINPNVKQIAKMMATFGLDFAKTGEYEPPKVIKKTFNLTDADIYQDLIKPGISEILPEELYDVIRDKKDKTKKKGKGKKGKKPNQKMGGKERVKMIRYEKIKDLVNKDIEDLSKITYKNIVETRLNCHESIMVNFMILCLRLMEYYHEKGKHHANRYDAAMSLSKAIAEFETIENMPQTLIKDAKKVYKEISNNPDRISIKKLTKKHFGLLTQTQYDEGKYFKKDQPYPDQIEFVQKLYYHIKNDIPLFCGYRTPPSSGKTTLTVTLCHLVHSLTGGKKQIIYCCHNPIVRKEVLKMLLAVRVPFAYGEEGIIKPHRMCYNKGFQVKPFRIAKDQSVQERTENSLRSLEYTIEERNCDKQPYILVVDLETTIEILKKDYADDKYVLFIDEPTSGLENGVEDNPVADMYTEIMLNEPRFVGAFSASRQEFDEIPDIVMNFCGKYIVGVESIGWVSSSRLGIGCLAVDKNGYARAPHHIVKTPEDLEKMVNFIEKRPFLMKFYTPPILVELCNSIPDLPKEYSLKKMFPDLSYLTHQNIRNCCLSVLRYVASLKDQTLIDKITTAENKVVNVELSDESVEDRYNMLFEELAHEHLGTNLIVSDNPHSITNSSYCKKLPSIKKLIKRFEDDFSTYEKNKQKIDKEKLTDQEKSQKMNALDFPILEWPEDCVVNSNTHITKYAPSGFDYDLSMCKINMIDQIETPDLQDMLKDYDKLFLSTIGVFDTDMSDIKGKSLNYSNGFYTHTLLDYADRGKMSYIFSDKQITYGTNLPTSTVFIDKHREEFTQNMLHQLIGRAGRPGKSKVATVIFLDDKDLEKTFSCDYENIEAETLCQLCRIKF